MKQLWVITLLVAAAGCGQGRELLVDLKPVGESGVTGRALLAESNGRGFSVERVDARFTTNRYHPNVASEGPYFTGSIHKGTCDQLGERVEKEIPHVEQHADGLLGGGATTLDLYRSVAELEAEPLAFVVSDYGGGSLLNVACGDLP